MSNLPAALAVLTHDRLPVLRRCLESLEPLRVESEYPLAVFEDHGRRDGTEAYLRGEFPGAHDGPVPIDREIGAEGRCHESPGRGYRLAFLGRENLGVAGNSNRAIRWFMEATDASWLLLANDDVVAHPEKGDFVRRYVGAAERLGVGHLCFCPFGTEEYRPSRLRRHGLEVRLLPRLTGCLLLISRRLVERIGYFDVRLGRYGNEHTDYTARARLTGFVSLDGMPQHGLDVDPAGTVSLQSTESSLPAAVREHHQAQADAALARVSADGYAADGFYRPFRLRDVPYWGGPAHAGLRADTLPEGYTRIFG